MPSSANKTAEGQRTVYNVYKAEEHCFLTLEGHLATRMDRGCHQSLRELGTRSKMGSPTGRRGIMQELVDDVAVGKDIFVALHSLMVCPLSSSVPQSDGLTC